MTVFIPTSRASRAQVTTGSDMPSAIRQTLILMGIPIDNLSMEESLDRIERFVRIGRRTGRTHQVATVNTDFLVRSLDDPNLRELLQHADMCTADGMPLVWGSRLLGAPLKERVAGSDLVPQLARRAAAKKMTMYFLGAGPGVAQKAARILRAEYPTLKIVGTACPFWQSGEPFDQTVLADIQAKQPDILLVAFGNPKQEQWIQQYGTQVGVPVQIGVGASFDFIAGVVRRAPYWMRATGLEWLARLLQEPRRLWKRYTFDFMRFGPSLLAQWWLMRSQPPARRFTVETRAIGALSIINLNGSLTGRRSVRLLRVGERALKRQPNLTINLADVERIDCLAIGTLMELKRLAEAQGGQLRLVGIQQPLGHIFSLLNLLGFFQIDEASLIRGCPG